jgi:hypothetical protein
VGSPLDAEYVALGGEARGGVMAAADGLRHGFGVRVWADGARYEGSWERDLEEGFGVYLGAGARGVRYEGAWHEGRREGRGVESYGDNDGLPYVCPLGNQHDGAARCFYDGEWRGGYYWGEGTLTCCDGRQYAGAWRKGKRHGRGRWVMLPADLHYGSGGSALVANRGDEGEFGAKVGRFSDLSRVRVFEGEFSKNKRTGPGKATLNNGDVLEGRFENGRADGLVRVTFGASAKVSYARFLRGERKAWLKGAELERLLRRDEEAAAARVAAVEKAARRDALMLRLNVFGAGDRDKRTRVGEELAKIAKKGGGSPG